MPLAVLDPPEESDVALGGTRWSGRPQLLALAAAGAVGVVLGYVGWVLPTPGNSLAEPTAIVLGAGAILVTASWVAACFAPRQRWLWTFAVTTAACTVLAAVWTFVFSFPAALVLDPGATAQAKTDLAGLGARQDRHGVAPRQACSAHASGSVGPLRAPYSACTVWTPQGHFVTFTAVGTGRSGGLGYLEYAPPGVSVFPDECVRHLIGSWWAFGLPSDAGGVPGQCPIGYRFEGGG